MDMQTPIRLTKVNVKSDSHLVRTLTFFRDGCKTFFSKNKHVGKWPFTDSIFLVFNFYCDRSIFHKFARHRYLWSSQHGACVSVQLSTGPNQKVNNFWYCSCWIQRYFLLIFACNWLFWVPLIYAIQNTLYSVFVVADVIYPCTFETDMRKHTKYSLKLFSSLIHKLLPTGH